MSDIVLCNNMEHNIHILSVVLGRVEAFFRSAGSKYREAYLAQVQDMPESERKSGHRGMFLP